MVGRVGRRALVTVLLIGFAAAAPIPPAAAAPESRLDPALEAELARGGRPRVVVELAAAADPGRAAAGRRGDDRARAVLRALRTTAAVSQREVLAVARAESGVSAVGYWLTNVVAVTGADLDLARRLSSLPGVTAVRAERSFPLVDPVRRGPVGAARVEVPWGIDRIGAPDAWARGILGQGVVVANIDTGVDVTHPALAGRYRGNLGAGGFDHDHNWWDPTGICGPRPCDNDGHGTHTMGTIVGGDGPGPFSPDVGVAPGARWIAAKGCEGYGCSESALLSSGQWVLAPTDTNGADPDPAKRPDIVSNSWGGGPGDPFYREVTAAWRAAGIIAVFASGNPGSRCGDAGSPGDYPDVLSVGATQPDDTIAPFSGRGPSVFGKINPDVSAPGVDVLSSVPGDGYAAYDGTSMAAPHVAGTLALMLSARTALTGDVDAALAPLRDTAVDRVDETCGGDDDGDPNNVYGEGRVDAAAAVAVVATGGTLVTRVLDTDGRPVAAARVAADDGRRTFAATTDAAGEARLFLAAGSYRLRVDAFGFAVVERTVVVETDRTTTETVTLDRLPTGEVTGRVRAAEDGTALPKAEVLAVGTPVPATRSGLAGGYRLGLPVGTYTLRVTAGGCTEPAFAEVTVTAGRPIRRDVEVVRALDDAGHGCRPTRFSLARTSHDTALWGDRIFGRLRLPFPFPFYGTRYEEVFVADDGYLQFLEPGRGDGGFEESFQPGPIPDRRAPNAAIYALAQDLTVEADATVRYGVIDDVPGRTGFAITWDRVRPPFGKAVVVQVRLWDDGRIDLAYGDNPANPGDGRRALVGIENDTGTDALQLGLRRPLLGPRQAYRIETVPTGLVTGRVLDANDGEPVAGAVVTATPGGRRAVTAVDGTFRLRLRPGRYTVETRAERYRGDERAVALAEGDVEDLTVRLAAPRPEVTPTAIERSVPYGEPVTATLRIRNTGGEPLRFDVRERARSAVPADLPPAPAGAPVPPAWRAARPGTPAPTAPVSPPEIDDLDLVVEDPADDSLDAQELTRIFGASDDTRLGLALEFSDPAVMDRLGGYVMLDLDQDPATGIPPEELFGKPTQTVGTEAYVSLFPVGRYGVVDIFDARFGYVGSVPVAVDGARVRFGIPLAMLGDDGDLHLAAVVGEFGPSDWAPDVGHGVVTATIDAAWLEVEPTAGTVAPGAEATVEVALGTGDPGPGTYTAEVRVRTDAPKPRALSVPVRLRVEVPTGWGAVVGRVTDAETGEPLGDATVTMRRDGDERRATTDGAGGFRLYAPAGRWDLTVRSEGYEEHRGTVDVVAGERRDVEIALRERRAEASVDAAPLRFRLAAGHRAEAQVRVANPAGTVPLRLEAREVPVGAVAGRRTQAARPAQAAGEVLASFAVPFDPWGLALAPDGRLLVSDTAGGNHWFTARGRARGSVPTPWVTGFPGDAVFDPGRNLVWQLDVGSGALIVGVDPAAGEVREVLAGEWSTRAQRGLAYDPVADVFYVGGDVDAALHRVAGPSWPRPGRLLHTCRPHWLLADISGLGWNGTHGVVWAAVRGWANSLAALDPDTCDHRAVITPPAELLSPVGAGLEVDPLGDLWWVSTSPARVSLLAAPAELRTPAEVPWLEVRIPDPVPPGGEAAVTVRVEAGGLTEGRHDALVVLLTNDPDRPRLAVAVTVEVTAPERRGSRRLR
jgi:subtilisin family serine protease